MWQIQCKIKKNLNTCHNPTFEPSTTLLIQCNGKPFAFPSAPRPLGFLVRSMPTTRASAAPAA